MGPSSPASASIAFRRSWVARSPKICRGQLADGLLLFAVREVHVILLAGSWLGSAAQRNDRGMPRPKMAMRSRWISLVPPPKVRMIMERAYISSRPAITAAGEPRVR